MLLLVLKLLHQLTFLIVVPTIDLLDLLLVLFGQFVWHLPHHHFFLEIVPLEVVVFLFLFLDHLL
jgi:hypothetical protein